MKMSGVGRYWFLISAATGIVTVAIGISLYLSRPIHLRIAVGPPDGLDAVLFQAVDQILQKEHAALRLDLVKTDGLHESNVLLGKRDVELAVVRLDDPLPSGAGLVLILRQNMAIIATSGRKRIESASDLKGKRVGLVVRTSLDEASASKLVEALGLTPNDIKLTVLKPDEVGPFTKSGRIDAVMIFGAPGDPEVASVIYAIDSKPGNPPSIVPIEVGDFLAANSAAVVDATISKNAFSRRKIPDDDVDTVGVHTVLAANKAATGPIRDKIYNNAITDLTKIVLQRHGELGRKIKLASLISAPDDDKSSRFSVHAGTAAFLADTDVSWYTLFSDQIWNVVLVGGMLSSICAGTVGFFRLSESDQARPLMDQLRDIVARAQAGDAKSEHAVLAAALSNVGIAIATLAAEQNMTAERFAPLQLAFEAARSAVSNCATPQKSDRSEWGNPDDARP